MIETIFAIIGLIFSAFFSGSEMAFIQANPIQIDVWKRRGKTFANMTASLLDQPERFLTTVLIGTNLANILTSSYATVVLLRIGLAKVSTMVIISFTILIFGEILPKVVFRSRANTLAVAVTPLIQIAKTILSPFIKIVKIYSRMITPGDVNFRSKHLTREDLKILFEEIEVSDEYEPEEKEVISKIFDFTSRSVKAAMTPVSDIVAIPKESTREEAIKVLIETGFSKLPVFQRSIEKIIGVVFLHDLFNGVSSVTSIMKRPLFVPESISANEALETLKKHQSSIAIVLNNRQKTVGLVTIEGLIEELFGEFEDVFDETGKRIYLLPDGNLMVDSLVEVEDLIKDYHFNIPKGDYETIGGFVLSKAGRIPKVGEILDYGQFKIKIINRTPNRLVRLCLYKKH